MSADRSSSERTRRLKALSVANGPSAKSRDYDALQAVKFGKSSYVRISATGTAVEEKCCFGSVQRSAWIQANVSNFYPVFGGCVVYGNDKWVAISICIDTHGQPTGKNILYSSDGINWKESSGKSFGGGGGYGVAYGDNRWVAVGNGTDASYNATGKNILYSSDGINWQNSFGTPFGISRADEYSGTGNGVAYGDNRWVAVGVGADASGNPTGKNILYSYDGINWQESSGTPFGIGNGSGNGVAYGDNRWVAVGVGADAFGNANGKNILYSYDGINWQESSETPFGIGSDFNGVGLGVFYGNNRWVAVGNGVDANGNNSGKNILYSSDGITWQKSSGTPFGSGSSRFNCGFGVVYGNNLWVAVGSNSNGKTILYSTDNGLTWLESQGDNFYGNYSSSGNSIAYDSTHKRWVAIGLGINVGWLFEPNTILYTSNPIAI